MKPGIKNSYKSLESFQNCRRHLTTLAISWREVQEAPDVRTLAERVAEERVPLRELLRLHEVALGHDHVQRHLRLAIKPQCKVPVALLDALPRVDEQEDAQRVAALREKGVIARSWTPVPPRPRPRPRLLPRARDA